MAPPAICIQPNAHADVRVALYRYLKDKFQFAVVTRTERGCAIATLVGEKGKEVRLVRERRTRQWNMGVLAAHEYSQHGPVGLGDLVMGHLELGISASASASAAPSHLRPMVSAASAAAASSSSSSPVSQFRWWMSGARDDAFIGPVEELLRVLLQGAPTDAPSVSQLRRKLTLTRESAYRDVLWAMAVIALFGDRAYVESTLSSLQLGPLSGVEWVGELLKLPQEVRNKRVRIHATPSTSSRYPPNPSTQPSHLSLPSHLSQPSMPLQPSHFSHPPLPMQPPPPPSSSSSSSPSLLFHLPPAYANLEARRKRTYAYQTLGLQVVKAFARTDV